MRSSRAVERGGRTRGLLAATVVGWALISAPFVVAMVVDAKPSSSEAAVGLALGLLFPAAIIGLPVSIIFCFLVGDLAWSLASRSGLVGRSGALTGGSILGVVLYACWAIFSMIAGRGRAPEGGGLFWRSQATLHFCACLYAIGVGAICGLAAWSAANNWLLASPKNET